ncbi:hypothetical protein M378DRAFT_14620 [Amanita muscaria Koide BX008]|uniref:F-box domain-containing protein n=1 Tax=Amanita muscaria (strain Koide BX008) TaxID=946122 RepID=A0A0C2WTW2_AMAMK|nr:hypothetical protein M378DRAFT_14620 [Amanita muscaria Koide BX008]
MQHIPAEIINEIFKHLILDILLVHERRKFPWYVGQICASWRAHFTSTPWIWRKFIIDVDHTTERDLEHATRLVRLCIQHSMNQPLSFSFIYTQKFLPSKGRQYVNQMLSDLIAESQRWEVVDVEADLLSLEAFCLPNLSNHFPLLHSMALRTQGILWSKPKCWELFLRAHSLTRVELETLPGYDFDWSRLTVLTFDYLRNAADVLPIMRRLHCIENFKLNAFVGKPDEEQDGAITLPTLKVLSCPGDMLRHLRAPALEELHVNSRPSLPLPNGAISFLQTSSGSLTRLILGNHCCILSDAKRILQELPNVTKLCVEADSYLLNVLPYNLEEEIPILPKLELLIVDGYLNRSAVETLCAAVVSRNSKHSLVEWPYGSGRLKELRMVSYEYFNTSPLKLLCEEREVKYLAFERLQLTAGHIWCSEVESCAFDLCNNNSLFRLTTESLVSR